MNKKSWKWPWDVALVSRALHTIAVGLGLVMLLVGVTMIIRSQGDQVTASAQKGAAKFVTEGAARSLSRLNQLIMVFVKAELRSYKSCYWQNIPGWQELRQKTAVKPT